MRLSRVEHDKCEICCIPASSHEVENGLGDRSLFGSVEREGPNLVVKSCE